MTARLPHEPPVAPWRRLGGPIVLFGLAVVIMSVAGVPLWRAVLLGVVIGASLWAMIISYGLPRPRWLYDVATGFFRIPTSWEVPGLEGARSSADTFHEYVQPRLWATTCELLRRRGIDPASDEARAMVGEHEYALLTGENLDARHISRSIPALCHRIAALATQPAAGHGAVVTRRALAGLAGRPVMTLHPSPANRKDHPR